MFFNRPLLNVILPLLLLAPALSFAQGIDRMDVPERLDSLVQRLTSGKPDFSAGTDYAKANRQKTEKYRASQMDIGSGKISHWSGEASLPSQLATLMKMGPIAFRYNQSAGAPEAFILDDTKFLAQATDGLPSCQTQGTKIEVTKLGRPVYWTQFDDIKGLVDLEYKSEDTRKAFIVTSTFTGANGNRFVQVYMLNPCDKSN